MPFCSFFCANWNNIRDFFFAFIGKAAVQKIEKKQYHFVKKNKNALIYDGPNGSLFISIQLNFSEF